MGGSYIGVTFLALMHILIFPIKILCHKLFDKTVDIDHQRTASFLDRRFSLRFDHGFPEWNNTDTEAEERKLAEISAEFFNHLHIRNDETAL